MPPAVLAHIEGADADDAFSCFAPGAAAWPQQLRVGVPQALEFFGDAGYEAAWAAARGQLEGLGHRAVPIDFSPLDAVAELLYDGPWVAERYAVAEALLKKNPDALDPTVRRIIGRAAEYSAVDAFRGQYRLRELAVLCDKLWSSCDVLMVPSAPGHPRFAEVAADPIGVNARLGRYTNFVNLLGLCALALPGGSAAKGLPFGITFIAPGNSDAALARFGRTWQRQLALALGATDARPSLPEPRRGRGRAARRRWRWPSSARICRACRSTGSCSSAVPRCSSRRRRRRTTGCTRCLARCRRSPDWCATKARVTPSPWRSGLCRSAKSAASWR